MIQLPQAHSASSVREFKLKPQYFHVHRHLHPMRYPSSSHLDSGWSLRQRSKPHESYLSQIGREDTVHWSLATHPHTPCGRNGRMAALAAHHCQYIFPSKYNKPAPNESMVRKNQELFPENQTIIEILICLKLPVPKAKLEQQTLNKEKHLVENQDSTIIFSVHHMAHISQLVSHLPLNLLHLLQIWHAPARFLQPRLQLHLFHFSLT